MQKIKYFQSVVKCKSFTRAAEENFISQSAISQQVQALERDLGVQLLNRSSKKIELTPAGEFFYNKTVVMLNDYNRICIETLKIGKQEEQKISVGYLRNYNGDEIKKAFVEFSQQLPEIFIEIIPGTHEELYDYLRDGKIDLAISDLRRKPSDQYVNFFLADRFAYAELPAANSLSRLDKITVEDLKNTPLVLVTPREQGEVEADFFREQFGVQGEIVTAENFEQANLIVSANRGYLWSEFQSPPQSSDSIKFVPIFHEDQPVYRKYYVFWKNARSRKLFEVFAGILKSYYFR